jgi:hypothetical protein
VVGAGLLAWALLGRPGDEERVRAQLEALERVVRVDDTTSTNRALRVLAVERQLESLVSDDLHLTVPELSSGRVTRRELAGLIAAEGARYSRASVTLRDTKIELGGDPPTARVRTTVHLSATRRGEDAIERDERYATLLLHRRDDGVFTLHDVEVASRSVIPD